jgi:D-xylose transport system substrate-binding protein
MDTLMIERWLKDKETFISVAKSLGADTVDVQAAESKADVQNNQCENMITNGIDVLVVLPYDSDSTDVVVEAAHKAGVKVIAYDRMINNADVDYYVSYDNVKIGEMEASPLVEVAPKGNYVLLGGAPTDSTSKLLRQGQMNILQPYIDRGDIRIVADQWVKDWLPEEALKIVENALTANNNNVQAIVASNDGTAGGAIQALAEQKLAGKVAIGGQDVELAACQRIVEGSQTASVYASPILEATAAAEAAVKLAKGEKLEANATVNNGKKDVPSILLTPVLVTKENMMDTVIKDGFHKMEEVYKNIPQDQWPQQK